MTSFPPEIVDAVLAHMNDDHLEDNLLIVRAFGAPDASGAAMRGVDGEAGTWAVMGPEGPVGDLRIPGPSGPIGERAEIRRDVVAQYDAAGARLGVDQRPH